MGEPYWGCDTLDQIARDCAPAELTLEYLNEALFAPLATMAGIVVQGKASPVFCTEEPWGSPMALPTGETLHLRTYPPRLLANPSPPPWQQTTTIKAVPIFTGQAQHS